MPVSGNRAATPNPGRSTGVRFWSDLGRALPISLILFALLAVGFYFIRNAAGTSTADQSTDLKWLFAEVEQVRRQALQELAAEFSGSDWRKERYDKMDLKRRQRIHSLEYFVVHNPGSI
jgi:hypothetical protein